MTTSDWLLDIALILIVLRQLRETRIDRRFVLIPAIIVFVTAKNYLHAIPTQGNDVLLVVVAVALGATLGLAGGLTTKVRAHDGHAYARAGVTAAAIWIASMTARLGFIVWITHSAGRQWLVRFSVDHHITGADVWQTALVLLALSEVIVRIGLILGRGYLKVEAARQATAPKQPISV